MDYKAQFVAITKDDGGVAVMQIMTEMPASALHPDAAKAHSFELTDGHYSRDVTDEIIEAEIARSALAFKPTWRRIDPSVIPTDRTFRDALTDDGKTVLHDMTKAKDIARNRIRAARDFYALDVTVSQLQTKAALGTLTVDDKAALTATEAQRQQLRDAPANPAIDAATTIDELKSLLP